MKSHKETACGLIMNEWGVKRGWVRRKRRANAARKISYKA